MSSNILSVLGTDWCCELLRAGLKQPIGEQAEVLSSGSAAVVQRQGNRYPEVHRASTTHDLKRRALGSESDSTKLKEQMLVSTCWNLVFLVPKLPLVRARGRIQLSFGML